ncbi:MAG: 3-phosphoshikimate 1-carboxyvinyltransferase, partial [Oscillospiraceae bacterium]
MYNVSITPEKLSGKVIVPPSKSVAHRLLICAALSFGESKITNMLMSKDITATINALIALGAEISVIGDTVTVHGITAPPKKAIINCCESGSTLRFLIPVACAFGASAEFTGEGKLPE